MAKAKKITEEELQSVQQALNMLNNINMEVGRLEISKSKLIAEASKAEDKLQEERTALEEKYGSVSIDLKSGEYTEIVEESEEVTE